MSIPNNNNYPGYYNSNPQIYYYTGPTGPPGPPGPPGMTGNLNNTAVCFCYAQLAHVIEQIIKYYPTTTIRAFTPGFNFAGLHGLPTELYASKDSTYGGLFVITEEEDSGAIPLSSIATINLGEGVAYNPAINYIPKPTFPEGFDRNIVTAVHDYLPISTPVAIYSGSLIETTGIVYKNEYGMLVVADDTLGNNATFVIPSLIRGIVPDFSTTVTDSTKLSPPKKSKIILTNQNMQG